MISWEKCCFWSANRIGWSYQWFTMSPFKPVVLWSLEHFTLWELKSFVLYNFLRGCESLVWTPDPDLPSGSWFWSWPRRPSLCLWCEKETTLSLGEAWTMMNLKECRMNNFIQSLVPSFQDRSLSNNANIFCIYQKFTTAKQVLSQQFHRWVTTP